MKSLKSVINGRNADAHDMISHHKKVVGCWLITLSGMVFVAVALGGVTRLTESGLSMVSWKLLGEHLPLNHSEWLAEFEKYKKYPDYIMLVYL